MKHDTTIPCKSLPEACKSLQETCKSLPDTRTHASVYGKHASLCMKHARAEPASADCCQDHSSNPGTDEPSLSQDCMARALRSYMADDDDAGEEEFYEVEVESGGGKRLRKQD